MKYEKTLISNRYKILNKLGQGSFGCVYKAIDIHSKQKFAIKFDIASTHSQLNTEIQAYQCLSHIEGLPKVVSEGSYHNKPYFVLTLLGQSLDQIFKSRDRKFSLPCIKLIASQLLKRLENIHDNNYIHRDIKPANLAVGKKTDKKIVFLFDLGLSKKFRDPITKQHVLYGEGRKLIGNFKYSSLNTHLGIEQSRRDDIESFFFVVLNFFKGSLPWDMLDEKVSEYEKIKFISSLSIEEICNDCPVQFVNILKYIRSIHFNERPNYDYIRNELNELVLVNDLVLEFDWVKRRKNKNKTLKNQKKKEEVKEYRRSSALLNQSGDHFLKPSQQEGSGCSDRSKSISFSIIQEIAEDELYEEKSNNGLDERELRRIDTIKDDQYPAFKGK